MRVAPPEHPIIKERRSVSTQRYLFIRRGTPGKQEQPNPAQMQEMQAAFAVWQKKFTVEIVDMGGRLKAGGKIVRASGVTDGPFTEAQEGGGGLMIRAAG